MAKKADRPQQIIEAALGLAGERRWASVCLRDIASAAGVSLADLHALYPSKTAILRAYFASVDAAVLGTKFTFEAEDSPRDRLFDVLMRRFDVLANDRAAVLSFLGALRCDPLAALCLSGGFLQSMRWMLEAAEIRATGPNGQLIVRGLAGVWLATLQVWRRDDSEDMSRTMAALDRNLHRAGRLLRLLPSPRRPRRAADPQEDAAPA